jgi:hypothetical protein
MAFLQSCLIRKNTKEIIDTLIEIGYEFPTIFHNFQNLVTIPYKGHGWGTLIALKDENVEEFLKLNRHNTIDCGTNEELFLALSSLKDDTDKGQWFVYDGYNPPDYYIQNGDWYRCGFEHNIPNGHKATVEEILKHFK